MKFGSLEVPKALGAILAHAHALPDKRLKKGHHLSQDDITALIDSGVETIIVAQLDKGDVEENAAAEQIALAFQSPNITAASAFTGRVNLHADRPGLFFADSELINAINRISPAITVSTLSDGIFVESGRMVATVKIIPLAAKSSAVKQAVKLINQSRAFTLSASQVHRVGLVATQLLQLKKSTMDKTAKILTERLDLAGSSLVVEKRVPHSAAELAEALKQIAQACDLIIIFGASAITDIEDVIPTGLVHAGGQVDTFGMPVDPGNLLLTGSLQSIPVIGAPGCARSSAENGFDWVLQRVLAKLPVDQNYLTSLGVGGLLKEIHSRPQPRSG